MIINEIFNHSEQIFFQNNKLSFAMKITIYLKNIFIKFLKIKLIFQIYF